MPRRLKKNTPMDHLITQCSGIADHARLNRKFNIVVVYETFVSAARALRACELLRQEIPPDVCMRINTWRIASLEDGVENELAASSASLADVVILSTPGREVPPQALHDWMDRWVSRGINSPTALLSLFGDHLTPAANATAQLLQLKASTHGIDFFMHPTREHTPADYPIQLGWKNNHLPPTDRLPPPVLVSHDHESAFDTIENFAAHLRALFLDLAAADLPGNTRNRIQPAF